MTAPTPTMRVDWFNTGTFSGPFDAVQALTDDSHNVTVTAGLSADQSAEASGELTFTLDNDNDAYTEDRNWADNPSFEVDASGWSTLAIASLTAVATSISQVVDNAGQGGTKAGEAVLTATLNSGITFPIPYPFVNGITYSFTVWLKSVSGNLNVRAGLASSGTPANIGSTGSNITASWAAYTGTFTPTADRTDVVLFLRTTTAAAATVRIDAIQVNPGATANPYIEAPTKGQLKGGRPCHFYGTLSAVDYPQFYGHIERVTPRPDERKVDFTVYDVLADMGKVDVVVPAQTFVSRSARDMYLAILEDFERGTRNLIANPSFETNTTGWVTGSSLTRITSDFAPVGGSTASAQLVAAGVGAILQYPVVGAAPVWLSGQTYRFGIYLRSTSGTQTWTLSVGPAVAQISRNVTVTTTWQRFSVTVTLGANYTDYAAAFAVQLTSTAAGTINIDCASVTRGQALYPYSDTGAGRWPNFCGNGSFDGGALNGWYDAWANLITNPSFETNTTGWVVTADAFHALGSAPARVTTGTHKYGSAHADMSVAGSTTQGTHVVLSGTFSTGVTYRFRVFVLGSAAGGIFIKVGIGSQGTPADFAQVTGTAVTTGYAEFTGTWTPTGNRSDAHFFVAANNGVNGGTLSIDGAAVMRRDPNSANDPAYSDTGPGGGGSFVTSVAIDTGVVQYGSSSFKLVTPATSTAGRVYDFNHIGSQFRSGQPYTASVWIRATTAMPYKVGWGANKGDGTWDEASTTGTLVANTWTQVTVTWTPSANRSSVNPFDIVLYVLQTNATGRTFYIDGVRVIPGASADAFEMTQWSIPATVASEVYATSAALSGTALSALAQISDLTLARYWIQPTMTAPYYQIVFEGRDAFAVKTVDFTLNENVDNISDLERDRSSVINVQSVAWLGGSDIYSDDVSVDPVNGYGPRPGSPIAGATFFPDRTTPDIIGPALISRYRDGARRPTFEIVNELTTELGMDLNDLIDLSVDRYLLRHGLFVLLTYTLTVGQSSLEWRMKCKVESYPF